MSCDSFRKHVTAAFGASTATHSLRKGGATYYARAGAAEDATRQQGGWRTTDVMKTIYTTLNRQEVDAELSKVVNGTSLAINLRRGFLALGSNSEEVLAKSGVQVRPFLALVASNLHLIDDNVASRSKIAGSLKLLSKHSDEHARSHAAQMYSMVASHWMATQSAKRARVQ